MRRKGRRYLSQGFIVLGLLALLAAGCSSSSSSSGASSSSTSSSGSGKQASSVGIAFFGFAAANSFAQATWAGIQQAAKQYGASAHFFDGNFSATTQVSQMQDAITSGTYKVFIVQANDGSAVIPEVTRAISRHIVVVAEFTPVGTSYSTDQPQVPGVISIVDVPTANGTALGKLGIQACGSLNPCQVAYLQGDPTLPLDVARTKAVLAELATDKAVRVVATPVGGYTQTQGRSVGQDLLTAHPNVNVIIGSSQAIEGVQLVLQPKGLLGKIKLIGNGGSTQAVNAVKAGQWYATYYIPETTDGYTAAKLGIQKALGQSVPTATNSATLGPALGTKTALQNVQGQYSD